MKYNFTDIIDRYGKDAIAVDGVGTWPGFAPEKPKEGFDFIPMWVADMNFATVPTIPQAMIERAKHPLYGYFKPREEYYNAIIKWHQIHHQVKELKPSHIQYHNGVIGGLLTALRVLASQGDNVLVHTPTYIGFTMSLKNNGFNIVHSPLKLDDKGVWRMDLEDMEQKIVRNKIHVAIFCSPHNPTGRVWEKEEIEQAMELFEKHNVFVISDEIWSDIILNNHKHIPVQSVNEYARQHTVALYAPSKTFNLAGLIGAYHICYNSWLIDRMYKEMSLTHYNTMNVLSMYALIGAYQPEGYEWVKELNTVLSTNINLTVEFINRELMGVKVFKSEGTYMLFIDCSEYLNQNELKIEQLLSRGYEYGVGWQPGKLFNEENFIRLNLALPTKLVEEALRRMKEYIF